MQYRRTYHPGACYFFTVVTHRRYPWFSNPDAVAQLRLAIQQEKARRPFEIDAFVVMPDHLHAVWTLPEGDSDYSMRWRNIKRAFTASIVASQRPVVSASRQHKTSKPSGSGDFGNIEFVMNVILSNILITSITTRSNTEWSAGHSIGRLAVSTVISGRVFCQSIGVLHLCSWMEVLGRNEAFVGLRTACNPTYAA